MAVLRGRRLSVSMKDRLFRPTLEGWRMIPRATGSGSMRSCRRVMSSPRCRGLRPRIREGDEVFVEGPLAVATGRAMMGRTRCSGQSAGSRSGSGRRKNWNKGNKNLYFLETSFTAVP